MNSAAAGGSVRLRLSGTLGAITKVLADLQESRAFRIEVDDRPRANRHGLDVRVYAELFVLDQEIPK
ncbi:hypothetical protein [Nocardia tengchongensis]|uniref:hypothetical protein n=1 Tax=Nocardia tengchongensis TaxID=2055889 RepID=UPI0036739012